MVVKEGFFVDIVSFLKFNFLVCWNDDKKKIVIICRIYCRVVSDKDNLKLRTGIFFFYELEVIYNLFCYVYFVLGFYLLIFFEEFRLLWIYFGYEECNIDYLYVCY